MLFVERRFRCFRQVACVGNSSVEPPESVLPILQSHVPSALAAVRAATRSAHERIEASRHMLRLMSTDFSTDEYRAHLGAMLGFYEPLEAALTAADSIAPFTLKKRALIQSDLERLGSTPIEIAALPRCENIPPPSTAGALGYLYVYEGASLGGQVIARRLKQSLGTTEDFAFYQTDGVRTASEWKAFCHHLETREALSIEVICTSALAVFEAFADWFDRQ